jgi:hypothetical protein
VDRPAADRRRHGVPRCWDEGAVWWEDGALGVAAGGWIEVQLAGTWRIDAAIVQADDNDAYLLFYRDLATGTWKPLGPVPVAGGGGMQTRPNPADNTERMTLARPVTTDALRFEATEGDLMYSVSEIQAFGIPSTAVP